MTLEEKKEVDQQPRPTALAVLVARVGGDVEGFEAEMSEILVEKAEEHHLTVQETVKCLEFLKLKLAHIFFTTVKEQPTESNSDPLGNLGSLYA